MACSWIRVDTTDQTTTTQAGKHASMIHVEDRSELFFCWGEDNNASGNSNSEIHFRRMNTKTHVLSSDITIQDTTNAPHMFPYMVRLDDGKLLVVYGDGNIAPTGLSAKISTDHGDTWGAGGTITNPAGVVITYPVALMTDGTDAWLIVESGGASIHDLYSYKYTASTNSWSADTKVFNTTGTGGTPGTFEWVYGRWQQRRAVMLDDEIGMMIAARCEDGGTDAEKKISLLRTDDGWATATVIDIEHYLTADDGGGHAPVIDVDENGRIVAAWVFAPVGATASMNCVVAYSDDQGETWTVTGVPTTISDEQANSGTQFRPSIEPALYLHPDGRTFLTTMGHVDADAARIYRYRKFYGSETSTDNWQVNDCSLDWQSDGLQINTLYTTSVNVTPHGIYMVVGATSQLGAGFERIYLLLDTSFTTGGGEGPPAPEPSPSGSDENNVYFRKVLGPNSGGWSVHSKEVTCWMPWDEGDNSAGREVPILTAGDDVFPALQDPALVGVINRIEAPDLWAVRVYVFHAITYDPLKMEVTTKQFALDGPHNRNVVRAVLMTYSRAGGPFAVELWVDDQVVDVWQFEGTEGRQVTRFHAVKTYGNVGSKAWLHIVDESVFPLTIDSCEFVYIKKGRRGSRA